MLFSVLSRGAAVKIKQGELITEFARAAVPGGGYRCVDFIPHCLLHFVPYRDRVRMLQSVARLDPAIQQPSF